MTPLRRFLTLQLLLVWQGGFVFYAAVVVPIGTRVHGAAGQGAVTARVTDVLNLIGAAALAALAAELYAGRDRRPGRTRLRRALWAAAALCHGLLVYFHIRLDELMPTHTRPEFYTFHRLYLITSTAQWFACALLLGLTLLAWRDEDRAGAAANGS